MSPAKDRGGNRQGAATTALTRSVILTKPSAALKLGIRLAGDNRPYVVGLNPELCAASSGLAVGDVILSVNGQSALGHAATTQMLKQAVGKVRLELAVTVHMPAATRQTVYLSQPGTLCDRHVDSVLQYARRHPEVPPSTLQPCACRLQPCACKLQPICPKAATLHPGCSPSPCQPGAGLRGPRVGCARRQQAPLAHSAHHGPSARGQAGSGLRRHRDTGHRSMSVLVVAQLTALGRPSRQAPSSAGS